MRHRVIDIALIAGLVAVAGAIMWTLFTLGSTPRAPASQPAVSAPSVVPAPQVIPVAPQGADAAGQAGDDAPADPPTGGAPAAGTPAVGAPAAGTPADGAEPPAAAPTPPPAEVPPGSVALERVGFSFVTGGPGACGVVLEPWTHVAVSRDFLAAYGCGARVRVTLDDPAGGRSSFEGVVGDTMNPVFARTVNVYVGTDEPALDYGVTTGSITPLD
jgi:hypothetical protein